MEDKLTPIRWATVALVVVAGVVAYHEWSYRQGHPGHSGPAGPIAVLAAATALGFGVLAYFVSVLEAKHARQDLHSFDVTSSLVEKFDDLERRFDNLWVATAATNPEARELLSDLEERDDDQEAEAQPED